MSDVAIPALSLVALIGASGSGKSTFAAQHFGPFETVSSDYCRGLVSNDANDQGASADAFALLHEIVSVRLRRGLLTVVDATNTSQSARGQLVSLARRHDVLPVAIVLDVPEATCLERNRARPDRDFGAHVVRRQCTQLRKSIKSLRKEGFRTIHVLGPEEIAAAAIVRTPLLTDRRELAGPFDIIGDVHGCLGELTELLTELGYQLVRDDDGRPIDAVPPEGRTAVFLGDLVDRGPDPVGVLRLAIGMHDAGHALAVPGNHEAKLVKVLEGKPANLAHGLAETVAALGLESQEFRDRVLGFARGLVSHLVLDSGRLVVAHAGLKEAYQGRASGRVRAFALYGDTTGESDEYGLPVRLDWAQEYRGKAMVVYGHTPVLESSWVNNTICLDTGCAFGGQLTALRYPERELCSVRAHEQYVEPVKPLGGHGESTRGEGELFLTDVMGRRAVETRFAGRVTVREENAAGALEVMSRFALDPRALPYLPPTMTPCATSGRPGYLEHPEQAFAQFAADGVERVICEEKHMGSRAVVLLARSEAIARERFGIAAGRGACYTRTGRSFFAPDLTNELLQRLGALAEASGLWDLAQDWALLDCELLPWSVKARSLIQEQYASVGAAAMSALPPAIAALRAFAEREVAPADEVAALLAGDTDRLANARAFREAYRHYVWPTAGLDGVQLAPFQLLASEGATYHDRDHGWHLAIADALADADGGAVSRGESDADGAAGSRGGTAAGGAAGLIRRTRRLEVATGDPSSCAAGIAWWEELTAAGGEGMVVKPLANLSWVTRPRSVDGGGAEARPEGRRKLVQSGVKVRGREYLRIIYGPDYTREENLQRLRGRQLSRKAGLALREYALGLEGLERLAAGEALYRVHEPVFAVLALESEPVDPRL